MDSYSITQYGRPLDPSKYTIDLDAKVFTSKPGPAPGVGLRQETAPVETRHPPLSRVAGLVATFDGNGLVTLSLVGRPDAGPIFGA